MALSQERPFWFAVEELIDMYTLFFQNAASGAEQAVGRVLGSLCVVTAQDGDAQSAMLASWISQVTDYALKYCLEPISVLCSGLHCKIR